MSTSVGRVGGCEWFPDGSRIQYARCWNCIVGQCPGGDHPWADQDDIDHAVAAGRPSPSGQPCGCVCVVDGPRWMDDSDPDAEDEWNDECAVCGSTDACGYDSEGRALIHATRFNEEGEEVW